MRVVKIFLILFLVTALFSCSKKESSSQGGKANAEFSSSKDKELRKYNLNVKEKDAKHRTPCDILSFKQYLIDNFPAGNYLVNFDRTYTYNIPKPAVFYYKQKGVQYIFAVIAKSKKGERFIEADNVTGFESSFINLDSTKLGTAFFYLTLFDCDNEGNFSQVWESEVPIHGGFNSMKLKTWKAKRIQYMELNFEAGIISGHRNYNYFFVDSLRGKPHLMETYEGIVHKRTLTDVNHDKYPDYFEYLYADSTSYIRQLDSIPFYWSEKKQLYITKKSRRWFRHY